MFDRKQLDTYITESLPKEYTPTTLFVLFDSNKGTIQYVFENPVEIVRHAWKAHSKYSDIDAT